MMEWSKRQTILILLRWEFIVYYSVAVFSGPARPIKQINRGGVQTLFLIGGASGEIQGVPEKISNEYDFLK